MRAFASIVRACFSEIEPTMDRGIAVKSLLRVEGALLFGDGWHASGILAHRPDLPEWLAPQRPRGVSSEPHYRIGLRVVRFSLPDRYRR